MKTLKKILPLLLLVFSILVIGSSCNGDDTNNVEPCGGNESISYTIDNNPTVNIDQWTAKLLINQGFNNADAFDIWSDDTFYIHTSTTEEGTYQYVVDYHNENGVNLFIPGVIDAFNSGTTNISLTFIIEQTTSEVDGCIHITFSGSYTDGDGNNHTISGDVQVALDTIHQS